MLVCACRSSRCISPTIYIRADADTTAIYLLLYIAAKRLRGGVILRVSAYDLPLVSASRFGLKILPTSVVFFRMGGTCFWCVQRHVLR